jgi:hypothetical protein
MIKDFANGYVDVLYIRTLQRLPPLPVDPSRETKAASSSPMPVAPARRSAWQWLACTARSAARAIGSGLSRTHAPEAGQPRERRGA